MFEVVLTPGKGTETGLAVVSSHRNQTFHMTITVAKSDSALPVKYVEGAVNERMELNSKLITSLWVQL